jgi:hypothetical protein
MPVGIVYDHLLVDMIKVAASSVQSLKNLNMVTIEEPCSPAPAGQGIFDRKDFLSDFNIRSLTPQSRPGGTGNALAIAVQNFLKTLLL